jgi:hypothetical protein
MHISIEKKRKKSKTEAGTKTGRLRSAECFKAVCAGLGFCWVFACRGTAVESHEIEFPTHNTVKNHIYLNLFSFHMKRYHFSFPLAYLSSFADRGLNFCHQNLVKKRHICVPLKVEEEHLEPDWGRGEKFSQRDTSPQKSKKLYRNTRNAEPHGSMAQAPSEVQLKDKLLKTCQLLLTAGS